MSPTASDPLNPQTHLGISHNDMPCHIAVIMDGNGRWAESQGEPRIVGHSEGAKNVRTVVTHCARLGIKVLTLYSFSSENWKRPKHEVDFLMNLYVQYLHAERETIMGNNIRFLHIGRRDGLPEEVLLAMDEIVEMSSQNTGLRLCMALNYGSRDEIVDGVRDIATDVREGRLDPQDIDEQLISASLYTASLPDPDLLIRTASERRISNFLLWQISYAEIHVCPKPWPEFGVEELEAAISDFAGRERRFGDVAPPAIEKPIPSSD